MMTVKDTDVQALDMDHRGHWVLDRHNRAAFNSAAWNSMSPLEQMRLQTESQWTLEKYKLCPTPAGFDFNLNWPEMKMVERLRLIQLQREWAGEKF